MTRQQLSEAWAIRGNAWAAIQTAERAILELRAAVPSLDADLVSGALAGARELLVLVTERIHAAASRLAVAPERQPCSRECGAAGGPDHLADCPVRAAPIPVQGTATKETP